MNFFTNSSTSTNSTVIPSKGESLLDKMKTQSIYLVCKFIYSIKISF